MKLCARAKVNSIQRQLLKPRQLRRSTASHKVQARYRCSSAQKVCRRSSALVAQGRQVTAQRCAKSIMRLHVAMCTVISIRVDIACSPTHVLEYWVASKWRPRWRRNTSPSRGMLVPFITARFSVRNRPRLATIPGPFASANFSLSACIFSTVVRGAAGDFVFFSPSNQACK